MQMQDWGALHGEWSGSWGNKQDHRCLAHRRGGWASNPVLTCGKERDLVRNWGKDLGVEAQGRGRLQGRGCEVSLEPPSPADLQPPAGGKGRGRGGAKPRGLQGDTAGAPACLQTPRSPLSWASLSSGPPTPALLSPSHLTPVRLAPWPARALGLFLVPCPLAYAPRTCG